MGQDRGAAAEAAVADALVRSGWHVLGRRVRFGREELDIIAVDPQPPSSLVIVEVRWRSRRDFGLGEESLDRRKRLALRRGIAALLDARVLPDGSRLARLPLRVDLVVVEPGATPGSTQRIRHHRGIAL
jgi:Holliday junction resolvase-like predicted endonuclease